MKVTKLEGQKDTLVHVNLTQLFPRKDCRSVWSHLWDYLRAEGNQNIIFLLQGKESKCDPQTSGGSSSTWRYFLGLLNQNSCLCLYEVMYMTHLFTGFYLWGSHTCFFWTKPTCLTATLHKCRSSSVTGWVLALIFPALCLRTQAPIEIHLVVNLGGLKPRSFLDKSRESRNR